MKYLIIALLLASTTAHAQSQTSTRSTQVTVQNAFAIAETTAQLSLNLVAISSNTAGTQAQLVLSPGTGATTVTQGSGGSTSRILSITAATRGLIAVTFAPPDTLLTVSNPGTTYNLTNSAAPSGTPVLLFTPSFSAVGNNFTTSATGALNINVGGTLTTQQSSSSYTDGTYVGTYQIQVSY